MIVVSLETFRVNYPEFMNAPDRMAQNALNEAYAITPASKWGTLQDQGAQLHAARALALSPFGRGLQLSISDGKTVYDERLNELCSVVAGGPVVL